MTVIKEMINKFTTEMAEEIVPPVVVIPEETKVTVDSDNKDTVDKVDEVAKVEVDAEKKEPEKEKESESIVTVEVTDLKAEIAKLQGDLEQAKAKGDSKVELDQANTLLKVKNDLVSEYEALLGGIIEAKLLDVPENLKELVPVNLTLKQQLDWITKAEKTGIFKPTNPDIEIGKPLNPNNVKQQTDTSKLSASAVMALAYGNSKGKGKK